MKFFKSLFRFYINSSIHVSFAVVALSVFTSIKHQLPLNYQLLAFIFLSSITGYNFVKYAPIAKLHHRSLTRQLKLIQIFSFVVFVGLLISLCFINIKVILICIFLGTVTLLYAIPIGQKNLREIAFLKVFIIAFIWASVTYILAFVNDSFQWKEVSKLLNFQFFERFLWIVLLMIPFEIRDLRFDIKHLKTLVSTFGVWKVKIGSILILVLLFIHKLLSTNIEPIWLYLGIYTSLTVAVLFAKPHQKPYYCSFYVEALPIFWMFLTCFMH